MAHVAKLNAGRGASLARAAVVMALVGACSQEVVLPPAEQRTDTPSAQFDDVPGVAGGDVPASSEQSDAILAAANDDAEIVVDIDASGAPIDPRVFGSNLPAWLSRSRFENPDFQRLTAESGTTVLRMPGGSWSNAYDWLACEQRDPAGCFWTWAATPSEFIEFLTTADLPGMWTVSINETAEQAAAAVAFFNGQVGDERMIGVDRDGVDWGQVGQWAELRAAGGHVEPLGMELWEVGNEVYGGKPEMGGSECASFGWEDVWTCDGTEYVEGDDDHDGYRAIRAAMRMVDPTISVGAVGVADPSSWSDWGNEVIAAAGDELDFYSVHHYGFDSSPDPQEAVLKPASEWPGHLAGLREALGPEVPIAVTEYNLISFVDGDTEDSLERAFNGLFIAETIGQFVVGGVAIANQWVLANGDDPEGTTYGMFNTTDYATTPQFDAMAAWTAMGQTLIPVAIAPSVSMPALRVYASRHDDGSITLLILSLSDASDEFTVALAGDDGADRSARLTTYRAPEPEDRLFERTDVPLTFVDGVAEVAVPPWSMLSLQIDT